MTSSKTIPIPEVTSLLEDLPAHLDEEGFESLITGSGWRLERILSTGHTTPPGEWYDQEQSEWVVVLQGSGRLEFEGGSERVLKRGDCMLLPARCRHRVAWTDPERTTVWLALHFELQQATAKDRTDGET